MKIFERLEDLQPSAPSISDIVSVEKLKLTIEIMENENIQKYRTPPLHFMIYKKQSTTNEHIVLECACLEFGRFHVMNIKSPYGEAINILIQETMDLVAEYIRSNVFEKKNDILIQELQTDFMNDFWKTYRMYSLVQASVETSGIGHNQQSQPASVKISELLQEQTSKYSPKAITFSDVLKKIAA